MTVKDRLQSEESNIIVSVLLCCIILGLTVEHAYSKIGKYWMHILVYNNYTQAHLRPLVVVEAKLTSDCLI